MQVHPQDGEIPQWLREGGVLARGRVADKDAGSRGSPGDIGEDEEAVAWGFQIKVPVKPDDGMELHGISGPVVEGEDVKAVDAEG